MGTAKIALAVLFALALGCKGSPTSDKPGAPAASGASADLHGAGATFPYPLYSKWIAEFQKIDPKVRINYQSIGSGGGIRQITERTVDFGASDAPMSDEELGKAPAKLVHVPMTLGAVVIAFNLAGAPKLQLSPDVVAGIFLGDIKNWNDDKIAKLNPDAKLPGDAISVAYRADGSGTTAVFTEYLAKVSPTWKEKVGAGKSVKFPAGLGAKGNEGVAGQIKTTPGTIGYVELAYAKQTGLSYAVLQNHAGKFVAATLDGVSAAASGVTLPDDLRVSIVDAPSDAAYPISAFTYILVYEDQQDAGKAASLGKFLWWAIHDGQKLAPALDYAPLPGPVVEKCEAKLRGLKAGGKPVLEGK